MKFGDSVAYRGLPGLIVAQQFALPLKEGQEQGYLVAFRNPALRRIFTPTEPPTEIRVPARDHWALTLGLNPDAQLGPSCNRLILENELEIVK